MSIKDRGFASMSSKKRRAIARLGGLSGGKGRGWYGDPEGHARAGRAERRKLKINSNAGGE
jgi:hypothetical protein